MSRKLVLVKALIIVLISMLTLVFNTQYVKADGSWVWVRNTVTGAYGEAVVGTGDAIYVARKSSFYCYDPSDNIWTDLAAPPNPDSGDAFKTGTALAWDFSDYIYALYGAATPDSRRWFYRYSISSNSWEALANTTADQGEGDTITWVGIENCIYATIGGEQRSTYFVRYDPPTNSWSDEPADPSGGVGDGASLVWTGGDFLYALRGEFYESSPIYDFWRYSLIDDVWNAMANIPADPHDGGLGGVGDGGSLLYVGFWLSNQTDYIYALSGNQAYPEKPVIPDNRTYRYAISLSSWEGLAAIPFGVGYYVGCRLGYADGYIYAWQGTPSTWEGGGDDLAYYVFPAPKSEYVLEISSTVGGTTDPSPGTYDYTTGSSVNVTAIPNTGYSFDYWLLDGDKRTEISMRVVMDANHTLEAFFVDDIPPEISIPIQEPPGDIAPYQDVTVTVNVTDLGSGVHNVTLWYSINNATSWIPLNMTEFSSNKYQSIIPRYENCTWVTYKIVAYDSNGKQAIEDNYGYYYIYHVISEFPLAIILPFFMTATLLAVIVYRRKHSAQMRKESH